MTDLRAIRQTLLEPFVAAAAGLGAPILTYQALPQPTTVPADKAIVRALVNLPGRSLAGADGAIRVQQVGTLVLQWLFPPPAAMAAIVPVLEATVAVYREQTLAGGVILTGDAQTVRIGREDGRVRWDVTIPWQTDDIEVGAGHTTPRLGLDLPTTAQALATVRSVWMLRIEQAEAATSWAGLRTYYDDLPVWQTPPPLPWAGYWCDAIANASQEASSGTERVVGRSLVQVHTDKALGTAVPLAIADRIVAAHNRTDAGVRFGVVQTGRQSLTEAGTWQTNLRIPFSFERLRAS